MPKRRKRKESLGRTAPPAATPAHVEPPAPRYRHHLYLALIIAVTFVAYLPALRGDSLWDDDANITKPELRSLAGLSRIWLDPSSTAQYYPLVHSVFWLEHKIWGDAVVGYHLASLLWHILSVLLVYSIVRKLKIPGALATAAIFALHPVMVESVAWITEQKNTLSAVFYLSAMRTYLSFDETRSAKVYFAALGLFALALAAKTSTVTLPIALLIIIWWRRGEISVKGDLLPVLPFVVFSICAGLVTIVVERKIVGAEGSAFDLSLVQRVLLAGRVIWFYLAKLVWPASLTFIYPRWSIDPGKWWQWLFPLAAIAATICLWTMRRRSRAPLSGWLFFCATLFPVMGFVNVFYFRYSFVADHFQYLAALGVIVPATGWVASVLNSSQVSAKWVGPVVCGGVTALLAVLTVQQCQMYGSVENLYRTTIRLNPAAWMAYNNLATYLSAHGRTDETEQLIREAIRLQPDYPEALLNLGWKVSQKGRFDEAIDLYKRALAARPDFYQVELDWGNTLIDMKRPQEAIEHYQAAARLGPTATMPQYNLGNTLLNLGDLPGAIEHYKSSLQLKPDFVEAHFNLGITFARSGRYAEAVERFRSAVELRPSYVDAHYNLGLALVELHRDTEAVEEFRRALQLAPKFFQAYPVLAKAYARLKLPADAIATAKEAATSARAAGEIELANGIEDWVIKYQTTQKEAGSAASKP